MTARRPSRRPLRRRAGIAALLVALALQGAGQMAPAAAQEERAPLHGRDEPRGHDQLQEVAEAQRGALLASLARATATAWPAGETSLGEAVARLDAGGNPTELASGVDPAQRALLPALDGTYWQAVLALCAAFSLRLQPGANGAEPGNAGDFGHEDEGTELALAARVGGGPVVLARRGDGPPPLLVATPGSPLLADLVRCDIHQGEQPGSEAWGDLEIALRLEPHAHAVNLGPALAVLVRGEDGGEQLAASDENGDGRDDLLHLVVTRLPGGVGSIRIAGQLRLAVVDTLACSGVLHPGGMLASETWGNVVTLRLVDGALARSENRHGPGLVFSHPEHALVGSPRLSITAGEGVVPEQDGMESTHPARRRGTTVRIEDTLRLSQDPVDAEYHVRAEGTVRVGQVTLPLALRLRLADLPAHDAPPETRLDVQQATMVAWAAGPRTLREALAALGHAGNQVVLELGVGETRSADLAAYHGNFWGGVAALCRAFDLTVLPAATAPASARGGGGEGVLASVPIAVEGGTVCLGAPRPGRPRAGDLQPCGPFLVTVSGSAASTLRSRAGVRRCANVALRLRLEPRLAPEAMHEAAIQWLPLAEDLGGGRAIAVGLPLTDEHREPGGPGAAPASDAAVEAEPPPAWAVSLAGLPAGRCRCRLHGVFSGQLRAPVSASAVLRPGERRAVALGGAQAVAVLYDEVQAKANGWEHPALGLIQSGENGGGEPTITLDAPGGGGREQPVGTDHRYQEARESLWFFRTLAPGAHALTVTGDELVAQFAVPLVIDYSGE